MDPAVDPDLGARERLVMVAARVFAEDGYRAASLDGILRRSGVAKSNFYYHFAGKLALACAAVDVWLEILGQSPLVRALQDTRAPGLERLTRFVRSFEDACADGPYGCPFGMLAAEDDLEPELRERLCRAFRGLEKDLAAAIAAGIEDGTIRRDVDPTRTAGGLLAAVQGAGLLGRATRCEHSVLSCALPIVELIATGPLPEPRSI
jgi:TetR/AcrR family transcriptional regulator, transcriptional repressor for nem operon